ncbi:MAG: COX15/CtaA family protein [Methylocella sp.]
MTWVYDPLPVGAPAIGARAERRRLALAFWLWSLAALVFLMVVVGGATRLTESGLSITQWKPISGIIPPLSAADWRAEFENYKQIPQYSAVFPDMDLSGFKFIFFFEWSHRLLGRLIGLATLLPLVLFWMRGMLTSSLKLKLLGVFALGGLQGFVGWWMVKSGLADRVEVAPERLAIHLLLASALFVALVWLASSLRERTAPRAPRGLRITANTFVLAVLAQIGLGALVAGLRAGRAYNTWPLIEGRLIPPLDQLTLLSPLWRNFFDNLLTVQFQHRMVAYAVLAFALAQAVATWRMLGWGGGAARATALALLAAAQASIGIATLVLVAPLWAALPHQAFAMIVLGLAVVHAQALSAKAP